MQRKFAYIQRKFAYRHRTWISCYSKLTRLNLGETAVHIHAHPLLFSNWL